MVEQVPVYARAARWGVVLAVHPCRPSSLPPFANVAGRFMRLHGGDDMAESRLLPRACRLMSEGLIDAV